MRIGLLIAGLLLAGVWSVPTQAQNITSIQPESGAPGTAVRIYGSGFSTTATDNTVEFGGTTATVNSATSTVLNVQVPSGPSGPVDVSVTVSGTTVTASDRFTVVTGGGTSLAGLDAGLTGVQRTTSTDWGDVNGDGALDLLVTGNGSDGSRTATVYLNDGSGGFSEAGAGLTGVRLSSSDVGDVDGDGNLDLVVTGQDASFNKTTTVYLGDGSGGFSVAGADLAGVQNGSSSFGDVDGDGNLDLLIAGADTSNSESARLYLGDGAGGFSEANAGLTGVTESASDIGDVDGDGNLDLVITGADGSGVETTTVYLGDGNGGFSQANAGLTEVQGGSVDLGDVDGNGTLDLLLTGDNGTFSGETTTLYLGDGTGNFSAANAGLVDVLNGSADIGDLDGDATVDLLVTGQDSTGDASTRVYLGDGTGSFSEAGNGLIDVEKGSSDFGDLDGDGDLDFVLSGTSPNGALATLYESEQISSTTSLSVTSFRPHTGGPGTTVRIEGSGFSSTASDNTVTFGGTEATVNSASSTVLSVDVPSGVSGPVDVGVSTPNSSVTAGDRFVGVSAGSESMTFAEDLSGVRESSSSWGDFNNDGTLDLLVAGSGTASLYLGDGDGGFTTASADLVGVRRSASVTGDFNGDGNLDAVITGQDGSGNRTTTVYLGDGSGGFSEAGAGLKGVIRGDLDVGDVNGDGNLDLVIVGSETATVYLGYGDGRFAGADAGITGVRNGTADFGDFDEDDNLDLLVTGEDPNANPTAILYLGDGSGGFSPTSTGLTGVNESASAVGDVDDDDHLDLVITGEDGSNTETATVYLGDGTGGFSTAQTGLTPVSFGSLDLGDLDGDGTLDLVLTGNDANSNSVTELYAGDGAGGFTELGSGIPGLVNGSSDFGDPDGDGDLDLVLTGSSDIGSLTRLYENEPLTAKTSLSVTALRPRRGRPGASVRIEGSGFSSTASDNTVTFDGTEAVVDSARSGVLYVQVPSGVSGPASVSVSTPDSSVTAADRFLAITGGTGAMNDIEAKLRGVSGSATEWADVNEDGVLDLIVTGSGTATVYLGDGSGGFSEAAAGLSGVINGSVSVGDVDGDGNLDVVITGSATTTVYLGDGSGGFAEANAGLRGVGSGSSNLTDVNGDGNLDLLVTGSETATLYLGYGDGRFTGAGAGLTKVSLSASDVGDVNNDGHPDFIITGQDANGNQTASIYLGDGSGGFTTAGAGLTGVENGSSTFGDVDDDGNLDVVVTGDTTGTSESAKLYLGDGTGGFSEANAGLTDVNFSSSDVGDVNDDGFLDVVITGEDANSNRTSTLYFGDGTGGFTEANAGLIGVEQGTSDFGDLDGDGSPDLLLTGFDENSTESATIYRNEPQAEPPSLRVTGLQPTSGGAGTPVRIYGAAFDGTASNNTVEFGGTAATVDSVGPDSTVLYAQVPSGPSGPVPVTVTTPENSVTAADRFTVVTGGSTAFTPVADLTGVRTSASAWADFDEDGVLDVVVTGEDSDGNPSATVYLGDGSGGFAAANAGLDGVEWSSVDVGDVNDDGHLDLVITGRDANSDPTTTVYLGDGNGDFSKETTLTGVDFGTSDLADLDGDGTLDLLVTGDDPNAEPAAAVYLGDGTGGFVKAGAGLTGVDRSAADIGDLNGDGHLDLVLTGIDPNFEESATVYLGDGTGTFTQINTSLTGVNSGAVEMGDVNNDGTLDLVLTGRDIDGNRTATLYLGDGTGGFTEGSAQLVGVTNSSLDLGDVDGDEALDLIVTGDDTTGTPSTRLYLGDGNGGASEQAVVLPEVSDGSSTFGDVNGDGDLDFVLTGGGRAQVYQNEPLTATTALGITALRPRTGAAGTMVRIEGSGFGTTAGDNTVTFGGTEATVDTAASTFLVAEVPSGVSGPVDVAVSTSDGSVTAGDRFTVPTSGGDSFTDLEAGLDGVTSSATSWGDFNEDGVLDLLVVGQDATENPAATVYLGDGAGGFSSANAGLSPPDLFGGADAKVADLDGDGHLDVVLVGDGQAQVYLGDGTGGFTQAGGALSGFSTVEVGDVNTDGNLDLLGFSPFGDSTATIYRGYGDGRFTAVEQEMANLSIVSSSDLGDVNGDGHLDLVLTGENNATGSRSTTVHLGDGTGTFTRANAGLTGIYFGSSEFGDVNGDGNLDLLLTGEGPNADPTTLLYLGDGSGEFTQADAGLVGVAYGTSSAVGDVDGDGTADLVVTGGDTSFTPSATVYIGDGSGGFSTADAGLVGVEDGSSDLGDFDGDGALDLVVTGRDTTGSVSTRVYGNGGVSSTAPPEIAVRPSSLSETLALGDSSDQSVQVENTAADTAASLTFEASVVTTTATASSKRALSQQHRRGTAEWASEWEGAANDTKRADPLSKAHSSSPPVIVDDLLGDADSVDVDRVRAGVASDRINVVIEHAGSVDPSNYGGFMGFDVDQDTSTGVTSEFLNPEQTIGAEYEVSFFNLDGGAVPLLNAETGEFVDSLQVGVDSSAIHFSVPLSKINGSPPINTAGVVGTASGPTDWFPNSKDATIGANWLTVSPSSGSVGPGNSQSLDVRFTAAKTSPGTYEAAVRITSNDPEKDTTDVPVTLTVEPPAITFSNPDELPGPGDDASIEIAFPSDFTPTGGTLFYRPAGARTFDTTAVDLSGVGAGGSVSVPIPGDAVTRSGVQYYARVQGTSSGVAETISFNLPVTAPVKTGFLPVQTGPVGARGSFESETYRMLTVPLDLGDRSVFDVLTERYGAYDESDWKLARWAPSDSSYRFGSAIDSLRPGQAAWLVTAGGDSLTIQNARSADASAPRSISLGPGWNQVGSPFAFPVAWADVSRPGAVRDPVAYDTSGYQFGAARLRPWRGAFVFNEADSAVTVRVPPVAATEEQPSSTGKSLAAAASSATGYRLQATAKVHRKGQTLTGHPTWLGFSEGAGKTGLGPKDRVKPPAVGPHVNLHVVPEEGPVLARSLKPEPADGAVWDLRVGLPEDRLDGSQEVTIVLGEHGTRPSGFQRYVVDRDRGRRLPVTNRSVTVELTDEQPTRRLRVIVGTEAFARQNSDGAALTIEKTKLRANAPNPFTESTTLAYQLAEEETVEIAVYDVLGRRVQTLVNETQEAGVYQFEWRPGRVAGQTLASGIYFCRMTAGDYTATRKLVLVR